MSDPYRADHDALGRAVERATKRLDTVDTRSTDNMKLIHALEKNQKKAMTGGSEAALVKTMARAVVGLTLIATLGGVSCEAVKRMPVDCAEAAQ